MGLLPYLCVSSFCRERQETNKSSYLRFQEDEESDSDVRVEITLFNVSTICFVDTFSVIELYWLFFQ